MMDYLTPPPPRPTDEDYDAAAEELARASAAILRAWHDALDSVDDAPVLDARLLIHVATQAQYRAMARCPVIRAEGFVPASMMDGPVAGLTKAENDAITDTLRKVARDKIAEDELLGRGAEDVDG